MRFTVLAGTPFIRITQSIHLMCLSFARMMEAFWMNPYMVGIITFPAVNANKLEFRRKNEIGPAMWMRILKVLSIGVKHAHDSIVLGAWGCGAFGNDGHEIAQLFCRALEQNFKGGYRQVVFAILDWSRDRRFIGPFQEAFKVN